MRPLLLILLVALVARLPGLNEALWFDEIWMLGTSVRLPLGQLIATYSGPTYHPLYTVLANLSVTLLGETPLALRLPALLFGLLAIGVTTIFVRLISSKREAFIVGMLFALSYPAVWYSQNARGYSGLMFFIVAASTLFYLGWQGRRWAWPWYAVVVGLGMYLHVFMSALPASHATLLILDRLAGGRLWAPPAAGGHRSAWVALGAAGALTALLYALAIPRMVVYYSSLDLSLNRGIDVARLMRDVSGGLTAQFALAAAALALAAVGLKGAAAYGRHDRLALALMLLPGIWGILVTPLIWSGAAPQFFIGLLPIGLMLTVRGIEASAGRWRNWAIGGLIIVSAAALSANYRYPKQDFAGALAYVRQHAAPDASVAGFGMAGTAYNLYYAPGLACIYTQDEYDALLRRGRDTWVLMTFPREARARLGSIYDQLQADFKLVATFPGTLDDGQLFVYYRPA